MSEDLIITKENGIATLRFNRPEAMNALSAYIFEHGIKALETFASDPEVKCVVVTGTGRAFCAGGDVKSMNEGGALVGARKCDEIGSAATRRVRAIQKRLRQDCPCPSGSRAGRRGDRP